MGRSWKNEKPLWKLQVISIWQEWTLLWSLSELFFYSTKIFPKCLPVLYDVSKNSGKNGWKRHVLQGELHLSRLGCFWLGWLFPAPTMTCLWAPVVRELHAEQGPLCGQANYAICRAPCLEKSQTSLLFCYCSAEILNNFWIGTPAF